MLHAIQNCRFIIDHQNLGCTAKSRTLLARQALAADARNGHLRQGYGDGEHAAFAMGGVERDVTAENAGNAFDNRQAKAKARGRTIVFTQSLKLLEHHFPLGIRDANAGVVNFNSQHASLATTAHENAARLCVLDGIGDEILHDTAQQFAVGFNGCAAGHGLENQIFLGSGRRIFRTQCFHEIVNAKDREFRQHDARIEARNIEERSENLFNRFQRGINVARQGTIVGALEPLHQARGKKTGGIQRLQNVVACGGNEPGLAEIGGLCCSLGHGQFTIQPCQLHRALDHTALKLLI